MNIGVQNNNNIKPDRDVFLLLLAVRNSSGVLSLRGRKSLSFLFFLNLKETLLPLEYRDRVRASLSLFFLSICRNSSVAREYQSNMKLTFALASSSFASSSRFSSGFAIGVMVEATTLGRMRGNNSCSFASSAAAATDNNNKRGKHPSQGARLLAQTLRLVVPTC